MLYSIILLNIGAFSLSRIAKIESTVSYLITLMLCLDIVYLGALVDKLKPATICCFAGCIVLFVYYIFKSKGRTLYKDLRKYFNIHTLLNLFSTLGYTIILKNQQPALYYWDEIRIWGQSSKYVKYFDKLYSIGINPTSNDRNYPPGHTILNYILNFFSEDFSEIMLLVAYGVFFFAVYSAASKVIEKKTKNTVLSIGSYFVFLLIPFLQNQHAIDTVGYSSISYAYGTTMVDFNIAVGFFAVLVLYFFDMNKFWYVLPAIYLITIKKNGIFFAILAFCIIMCFEFFTGKFTVKKFRKLAATVIAGLIIPLGAYLAWNIHLDRYRPAEVTPAYNLKVSAPAEILSIEKLSGDKLLVEPKKNPSRLSVILSGFTTERYKEVVDEMKWYFNENKEIVHIKDKHLITCLFALGFIAAFLSDRKYLLPIIFTNIGIFLSCFIYNLLLAWQIQFYNDQMVEYPRYMLSYYYGWLFVVIFMAIIFVKKHITVKKAVVLSLIGCCMLHLNTIGLNRTVISHPGDIYAPYRLLEKRIEPALDILNEGDRVLLVWMSGYDDIVYSYKYYFMPAVCNTDTLGTGIDFSIGFRSPELYTKETSYFNYATPETFAQLLKDYYDYVYICNEYDWDFELSYGSLFDTPLSKDSLYKVTDNEIPLQKVV